MNKTVLLVVAIYLNVPVVAPAAGVLRGLANSIDKKPSAASSRKADRPSPPPPPPSYAGSKRHGGSSSGGGGANGTSSHGVSGTGTADVTPPGLGESFSILESRVVNSNWTSVAIKLRDPDNRGPVLPRPRAFVPSRQPLCAQLVTLSSTFR